ncbi:MAG TPA: DUF1800 domain-containing protein [Blastocatellia bacterium]|nr:DUF1800 domain-containing protein [Blastocatellia bacterium]
MQPLTADDAAHLLRRMGFGGAPEEVDDLVARGREGAVDYLINYEQINNSAMEDLLKTSFDFSDVREGDKFNQGEIRRWWFTRMVHSRRQFEEKMALFWHNHFATALSGVSDILMFNQHLTLRKYLLSRFDDLLLHVAQDPAMLVWLDGITNVLGAPNENWARELQELFTMGPNDVVTGEPNYTEDDVKEIARAFTGWKFRLNRRDFTLEFFVNPSQHDNGAKTVYGQTANFSGEDIITIICDRRATARYLVRELFNFFVYELTDSQADKKTIEKFADVYVSSNHSIRELARAIFTSKEFFSDRARFALIKQPAELVVGTIRMLGGEYEPGVPGRGQQLNSNILAAFSRLMGQDIFNPPDVNGWDLGLAWVSTATMLERFNFGNAFVSNRNINNRPGIFITNEQLAKYTKPKAKKTVKEFLRVMGRLNVDKTTRANLQTYLETDDAGNPTTWAVTDATIDEKVRGLVHQIICLPEYQLN